jgi:hypothetical protein
MEKKNVFNFVYGYRVAHAPIEDSINIAANGLVSALENAQKLIPEIIAKQFEIEKETFEFEIIKISKSKEVYV